MSTTLRPADNSGLPTLADAKAGSLKNIAGVCANSDEFLSLVNQSTERLLYRGDWPGTVLPIQMTINRGVVTYPRLVGSVRYLRMCHRDVPVFNQWYRFLPHTWRGGNCCGVWQNWINPRAPNLSDYGRAPTFAAIPTNNCVIRAYSITDDNGQEVRLFGLDTNGNALRTDNGDGTFSDGIAIVLNSPFVATTIDVSLISRVLKPITQGNVQLTAFDTVTLIETSLADYQPSETNPSYAQYVLDINVCDPTKTFTSVALVKLQFIPVLVDTDPILIPNLHALKLWMQSIRFEEAGDRTNAKTYQVDAIRELNLQLNDQSPVEQIPIQYNPFGSASPRRYGVGKVI